MMNNTDKINRDIEEVLSLSKNIAIVGLSGSPNKPSFQVAEYLMNAGYNIYPVNPYYEVILKKTCYPDLQSISDPIDIIDIFRKSDEILPIVKAAIETKAKVVWMQLGIVNQDAAILALKSGLKVMMDRCIKLEHQRYFI